MLTPVPEDSEAREACNWIGDVQRSAGIMRRSLDPATGAIIGHYPDDGLEAAGLAVAAASRAFRETAWPRDHQLRARVLEQLALRPALLEVSDNNLPIIQEEIFGPVLTIQRFADESAAVRLANDSEFGLATLEDFQEYKHIALKAGLVRG